MPRIEERHALELKGKRSQRHGQLAIGQKGLQRRLQKIVQAIFQLDDVLRRANPRDTGFQSAAGRLGLAGGRRGRRRARRAGFQLAGLAFAGLWELEASHANRRAANGNLDRPWCGDFKRDGRDLDGHGAFQGTVPTGDEGFRREAEIVGNHLRRRQRLPV